MRWLFRSIVISGFLLGLLLGFFVFDVARAQTETPTPTPTITPWPTVTPWSTPGPTPVVPFIWWCQRESGAADVCTWGDYFEVSSSVQSMDGLLKDPGSGYRYLVMVPPEGIRRVELRCQYSAGKGLQGERADQCAACGSNTTNGSTYGKDTTASWVGGDPGGLPSWTGTVVITVSQSSGLHAVFPVDSVNNYFRAGVSSFAYGSRLYDGVVAWAESRVACEAVRMWTLDNTELIPPSAYPDPDGTPTPGPWDEYEWIEYGPYVQAPPQNSSFSFSESSTQCFAVLPGASFVLAPGWLTSVIGLPELAVSWSARSLCLDQWTISGELMNVPVSSMVSGFVSSIILLWMVRTLRGSGG